MADPKRKANAGTGTGTSDNGTTPAKRQRVSRACDQCRAAREKCDGIQPICFTCASSNRACSYATNPKKRGIQPGYIKSLEIALAWTFANVPGSEDALKTMLNNTGPDIMAGKDSDGSYKLHRAWRRSSVYKEIDRLLSGSEEGPVGSGGQRISPESVDEDQEMGGPSDVAVLTPLSISATEKVGASRPDILSATEPAQHKTAERPLSLNTPQTLILPSDLWQLIDIYYAYTHCWLPIIEKQDILKIAYSYSDDGVKISPLAPGAGDHAELWSIIAIASYQAASAELNNSTKGPANTHSQQPNPLLPSTLYDTAKSLIPSAESPHELGHVKALILLSLINIGRQSFSAAWLLIGQAIRVVCLLLQPQNISHQQGNGPNLVGRQKHVMHACYCLDSFISAQLGQIPHFRRNNFARLGLIDEDGLDEWHAWVACPGFGTTTKQESRSPMHALSTFNNLILLSGIICDELEQDKAELESGGRVAAELQHWLRQLPPFCGLENFASLEGRKMPTPSLFNLKLSHLFVSSKFLFGPEREMALEQIVEVLERYISTFSAAALSPMAGLYIADVANQDTNTVGMSTRLNNIQILLNQTWPKVSQVDPSSTTIANRNIGFQKPPIADNQPNESNIPMSSTEFHSPILQQQSVVGPSSLPNLPNTSTIRSPNSGLPRNLQRGSFGQAPLVALQKRSQLTHPGTLQSSFSSPRKNRTQSISSPTYHSGPMVGPGVGVRPPSIPDNANLAAYDNHSDIDALFDELASLDGGDSSGAAPQQFMQNLGFAPDADLTDLLASDYGQFDPFSVYMQHGALHPPSMDQG